MEGSEIDGSPRTSDSAGISDKATLFASVGTFASGSLGNTKDGSGTLGCVIDETPARFGKDDTSEIADSCRLPGSVGKLGKAAISGNSEISGIEGSWIPERLGEAGTLVIARDGSATDGRATDGTPGEGAAIDGSADASSNVGRLGPPRSSGTVSGIDIAEAEMISGRASDGSSARGST